jgi:16S rRNA (guanine527-N7)-methyltransferase
MERLAHYAAVWGLPLSATQREQFRAYLALLLQWNEQVNLTAIRDPAQIEVRHFLDSLSCATVTGDLNGLRLIDVGSGAGFPGLPLKILYPHLKLALLDSVGKKTRFLEAAVAALELQEVTVLTGRAELLGHQPAHRGRYDWAAARSVADLRVLVELLLPLCHVGGHVLAQKGTNAAAEVEQARHAITLLGGATPHLATIQLPGVETPHHLVVIPKVAETGSRYPRRVGIPAKRPL